MLSKSTDPNDYQSVARPVAAMPADYRRGHQIALHRHARHQLLLSAGGVAEVRSEGNCWVVPPGRAVWIPAGIAHSVSILTATTLNSLYIDRYAVHGHHPGIEVLSVPPLMNALIEDAMHIPVDYDADGRDGHIMALILADMKTAPRLPLATPEPTDRRLRAICDCLKREPWRSESLTSWGLEVGATARTLSTLFKKETGLTFGRWRQQARLVEAARRLALEETVEKVAGDVGYASQSAFASMFRRALGVTPGQYFQTGRQAPGVRSNSSRRRQEQPRR